MISMWRPVAAVTVALALCCVVTLTFNGEIKLEAHEDDMSMYDTDSDARDELSPGEKALIAAASGDLSSETADVSLEKITPAKSVSKTDSSKDSKEDTQDRLSSDEETLIKAATVGSVSPESLRAPSPKIEVQKSKTVTPKKTRHDSRVNDDDGLSAEEQDLVNAAQESSPKPLKKAPKIIEHKTPKVSIAAQIAAAMHTKAKKVTKTKKVQKTKNKDELSPEDEALINAATNGHGFKGRKSKPVVVKTAKAIKSNLQEIQTSLDKPTPDPNTKTQKKLMQKAMERITKGAAQKAVAAALGPAVKASPVAHKTAQVAPIPTQEMETSAPKSIPQYAPPRDLEAARQVILGVGPSLEAPSAAVSSADVVAMEDKDDDDDEDDDYESETTQSVPQPLSYEEMQVKMRGGSHIKPMETISWEQTLANADAQAAKLAAQDGPRRLTPSEVTAAEQMRQKLESESKKSHLFVSRHGPADIIFGN